MITYTSTSQSLIELGQAQQDFYAGAPPYPHIVLGDFFDPNVLECVLSEAQSVDKELSYAKFIRARTEAQKYAFLPHVVGPETAKLINFLNSGPMISYLEKLTGISGLLADPSYFGGGVHLIGKGGFLEVHVDFNHLKKYNLERRVNLLLYLNKDWRDEYNGNLELWDRKAMSRNVEPLFNRCVVFSTNKDSLHGHPAPLQTPEGIMRYSIALYYYTNTWRTEDISRNTLYYASPNNEFRTKMSRIARDFILDLIPPIFRKGARAFKRRIKGETLKELNS